MNLNDNITEIPGIGAKRAQAFYQKKIVTVADLLHYFPRKYQNRKLTGSLENVSEEPVTVKIRVVHSGVLRRIRKNMTLFLLQVEEAESEKEKIKGELIWFNQPYLKGSFIPGEILWCYGKIVCKNGRRQIYNPQYCRKDQLNDFLKLIPVYSKIEGVPSIERYIRGVFDKQIMIEDPLPEKYKKQFHILSLSDALKKIHMPETEDDVYQGRYRIKFEEALKINLGILNNRCTDISSIHLDEFDFIKRFINGLPFCLTEGQKKVIEDIKKDFMSGKIMNRLVQGDVGSGKTIIAVICCFLMAMNGYQSAYMAPTEILAEQHADNFSAYLEPYGIRVACLTGSLKGKERQCLIEKIASGDMQVIIGTHALIQSTVDYYNLGLVITDEQHRFGVRQRGRLSLKGKMPHTLVMSATPIPRTLSLIIYGDLDVSYIDELPSGRKKIKTYFYGEKAMPKILEFMAKEMDKGRQTFVICPFIEESEEMGDVKDIKHVYQDVCAYYKKRYRIGCLYSRMSSEEKKDTISAFNKGEIDQLVSTSIIEVGIDVPNVSVITILSAERFGLSQLHQLRGRTGRGRYQSYCFLVSDNRSEQTIERMKVIVNNSNGRQIADEDYRLRGPGDYFGAKQHGFSVFQALDPYNDLELIQQTRKIAQAVYSSKDSDTLRYRAEVLQSFYKNLSEITMN